MFCPIGDPVSLFIITDHLKMGVVSKSVSRELHHLASDSMLFLNKMRIISQNWEGEGERDLLLGDLMDL